MSRESNDPAIRELFRALRLEDERLAPSFARVWAAAASRTAELRRPSRALARLAAAAAVLTMAGVATVVLRQQTRPPSQEMSISQWRSPTSFLLASPSEPLLKTVPQLSKPVVEIKMIAPAEGGTKR